MQSPDQILSVAQMRAAEDVLIEAGHSVEALMDLAGRGAAEWVWRIAARQRVTVLCGPGNNGGDGYVIAQAILERGGDAVVVAAHEPKPDAARNARALFQGEVLDGEIDAAGEVFVDCLFGSGLTRPLAPADEALITRLARRHRHTVAIDVPSGVHSDTGELLARALPRFDLTLALGAWKFAHFLMPASAIMGDTHLVDIAIGGVERSARKIARPSLSAPPVDAHKYTRGLVAVVGGAMPGAAVLSATAAQGAGAGYVKLLAQDAGEVPHDLVATTAPLLDALADDRIAAGLIGPGLGRDAVALDRLHAALASGRPLVLDADALILLQPEHLDGTPTLKIATPHAGELARLEQAFGFAGSGSKPERALALARVSGMTIVAKGPDTVVAAPDGRLACAGPATSWLSTAGTGDVLAGIVTSRLASGLDPFAAACEGVWLHAEAARLSPPAFTAGALSRAVPLALAACL